MVDRKRAWGWASLLLGLAVCWGCSNPETPHENTAPTSGSAAQAPEPAGAAEAAAKPQQAIQEALQLLESEDPAERAKGAQQISKIGDPALQPLLNFFDDRAYWVRDYFFRLTADQFLKEFHNPAGYLADVYLKFRFRPAGEISMIGGLEMSTRQNLGDFVKNKIAALNYFDTENPNLIVQGLRDRCDHWAIDETYVDTKTVSEEEVQLLYMLITGTCQDINTMESLRFRVLLKGGGSFAGAEVHAAL